MEQSPTEAIVHRDLEVDGPEPATQITEHVSAISGRDVESLASTWDTFGHVVDDSFKNPPAASARVQVTFTYEGYRVTVEQVRHTKFVPVVEHED